MRELTSDLVRSIRAFATNANNPNVYVLTQIPAPNPRGRGLRYRRPQQHRNRCRQKFVPSGRSGDRLAKRHPLRHQHPRRFRHLRFLRLRHQPLRPNRRLLHPQWPPNRLPPHPHPRTRLPRPPFPPPPRQVIHPPAAGAGVNPAAASSSEMILRKPPPKTPSRRRVPEASTRRVLSTHSHKPKISLDITKQKPYIH